MLNIIRNITKKSEGYDLSSSEVSVLTKPGFGVYPGSLDPPWGNQIKENRNIPTLVVSNLLSPR